MSDGDGKAPQTTQRAGAKLHQIGSYRLIERIGSGGMGNVYKAIHVGLDREVALKLLPSDYARNPRLLTRFHREAKAAAALEHPNIVAIHDQGEVGGICYLAMEYVEGEDLADWIARTRRLPTRESVDVLRQVAQALGHAHQRGIIHRDIKPSNILIRARDNAVKLADLGLAQRLRDDASEAQVTRDGTTVGTVDYMAPEQARESKRADARSDIYALGCTWYHMLTGRPPFPDGTIIEKLLHHSQDAPPDPRKLNPAVTESMVAILNRMLRKSPAERYQGVGELLADLENVCFEPKTTPYALDTLAEAEITLVDKVVPIPLAPLAERDRIARRSRPQPSSPRVSPGAAAAIRPVPKKGPHSRKRRRTSRVPNRALLTVLGVACGVVVLLVVAAFLFSGSGGTGSPTTTVTGNSDVPPVSPDPGRAVAVVTPTGPAVSDPAVRRSPTRPEFAAPWRTSAFAMTGLVMGVVSRGPSETQRHYVGLAEALASLPPSGGIVEIADNGPLFEPGVELRDKGRVVIRAAEGFAPLVVFEPQRSDQQALVAADGTDVQVEGIHFVAHASESTTSTARALLDVQGGDLLARRCTFSILGDDTIAAEWAAVRVGGPRVRDQRTPRGQSRVVLDTCHVRGSAAGGLILGADSADVVIENSLIAVSSGTVFQWQRPLAPSVDAERVIRVLSSTLVSARELFRLWPDAGESPAPTQFLVADSVLACPAPDSSTRMLELEDWPQANDGRLRAMTWQARNVFYAGWSALVSNSSAVRPLARNLVQWAQLWQRSSPADEQLANGGWPNWPINDFSRTPAELFQMSPGGPVAQGLELDVLGVATEGLPRPAGDWYERSVGRYELVPRPNQLAPEQQRAAAGRSVFDPQAERRRQDETRRAEVQIRAARLNGEPVPVAPCAHLVIDAERDDVGAVISASGLVDDALVAITGSGTRPSSPIRITSRSLRLRFIASGRDELVLTPKDGKAAALVEVVGGNLEIEGATFGLEAKASAHPRWFVRVQGGNLVLKNCRMRGPGGASPFEAAICWQRDSGRPVGRQTPSGAPPPLYDGYCIVSDCLLVGGSRVIDADVSGRAMFLENNVFVTSNDLLRLGIEGELSGFGASVELTSNTACVLGGGALVDVAPSRKAKDPTSRPLRLYARRNLFCKAFDVSEARPALLRYHAADLHAGLLAWQGDSNAYSNVARYLEPAGLTGAAEQDFRDVWVRAWGLKHAVSFSVGLAARFAADALEFDQLTPEDFALGVASEIPAGTGADVSRLKAPRTGR